ncbi:uncharacterized protein [Dermacentor andersoni]|uniref:uncharacterized protein n=1 Tax=Dermacentor andersoni TaxID=34620 RepID=UPI003B3B7222
MAFGVRIGEFHLNSNSSWEDYVERIELCCTANKLKEDSDKRAVLLSCCGEDTYSLIATLVKPLRPPNADYQSIVNAVKNHINLKPSELYSRYVFSKRDQHDAESVADYVTALRKLAGNCGFNDNQLPLDVMLRDRLVFGISDSIVQQRLLAEKDITFKTAYDLAVTAEAAAKHQRVMGGLCQDVPDLTAKVDRQTMKQHKNGQDVETSSEQLKRQCFRCFGNHAAYRCRFKTAVCFNCSVKGHLAKACRKKQKGQVNHQLEDMSNSEQTEYDDMLNISQVTSGCPKFMVAVSIGGEIVSMEVDSGAARSIISENTFSKLKVARRIKLEESDTKLVTWTKEGLDVIGKATLPVKFKEQDFQLPILVVRNEGAALPPLHIELKEYAQPKFLKCRSIPFALKDDVITELEKLERQGVLQPTQYSEWATPVVIVRKKDGSLRICGDYRSTVNQAVAAYLDDILVASETAEEHHEILMEVLNRLSKAGLRIQGAKCQFFKESLAYLGHRIDATGICPSKAKVEAIHKAPVPKNKKELQAFLGMVNFYNRFLKGRSEVAEVLYHLLDSESTWNWGEEQQLAFERLKTLLTSESLLVHFNPDAPLILSCDSSPGGVGAVLAHRDAQGREQPVAYASRTLTKAERNYAQIDREALAIVYGVRQFHQYLCGREFRIFTDHKPLLGIFQRDKQIPVVLSPRMLRWSLLLSAYEYKLEYRRTQDHANADCLSRLPIPGDRRDIEPPGDVLLLEAVEYPPVSAADVSSATMRDPCLSRVKKWVATSWPEQGVPPEYAAYQLQASSDANCSAEIAYPSSDANCSAEIA